MAGRHSQAIAITDAQRTILEQIVRRQTSPQHQVRRARIVLLAAAGEPNQRIAARQALQRVGPAVAVLLHQSRHCASYPLRQRPARYQRVDLAHQPPRLAQGHPQWHR